MKPHRTHRSLKIGVISHHPELLNMKDNHIRTLEKEVEALRRERQTNYVRLKEEKDVPNRVKIQQSMKITLEPRDQSHSPKICSSFIGLTEGDKIRLEGTISLLTLKNEMLQKDVEKYKHSRLCL